MGKFLLRRIGYMLVTLWVVVTATFFLMNTLPGDPIKSMYRKMPPQVQQNIKRKWGMDKPITQRYVNYLKQIVTKLDLGESMVFPGETFATILRDRLPASARLGFQTLLFGLTIGILMGIIAAFNRTTWIDYTIVFLAILGISIPGFVLALLIQKYLGGKFFPILGWPTGSQKWFGGWEYTILPTIANSFGMIAQYSRFTKTAILDVMNQDYVLTAKSKGLTKNAIIFKHVFRNAMIPLVTMLPVTIMFALTGSLITERIFSIPGIGMYYIGSINARDHFMIMGQTIFFAAIYIVALIFVDICYVLVDPRIRVTGGKR
jgi:oligopeptide transport system permease protein